MVSYYYKDDSMNQNKYHVDEFNINNEEIAFISDTHLGSIIENIDAINKAFDIIPVIQSYIYS
jgi:predicted ATP-dependent serine protease